MPDLVCPVLRPSLEDVRGTSFEAYIQKHEKMILAKGVVKIVGEWVSGEELRMNGLVPVLAQTMHTTEQAALLLGEAQH